ncbi:hypothetical protein KJ980_05385 [Patescibacteria group bacterium]|nr:hypothetical protein [Patescibacteria group bacterium]MBU4016376.1 hypothetical protein [Patescibacteria group bacterium]MBU4099053.1 hypothetical protein [Patescibacteria group bacterium]
MIKKILLICILCIVVIPAVLLKLYAYYSANKYIPEKPPTITADSLKSLSISLIQSQEDFNGTLVIETQIPDHNKAEITFLNNYSGGDSVGATEYKMIAEKKNQLWTITNSKTHWKCFRDLFFNSFWTTSACP